MEKKNVIFLCETRISQVISLLVGGSGILIRLEIEYSFILLSNDILIGWITLQHFDA